MRSPQTIVKRPLLTEKGARLRETGGKPEAPAEGEQVATKLLFEVAKDANKIEIKDAVQRLFNVKVKDVRTVIVRGKWKRIGKFEGRRPHWKKAIVTLQPGDSIELYEGV